MYTNPWYDLPTAAPFVLPEDRPFVDTFNTNATTALRVRVDLLPEPFIGRPDAPVMLLALNPGWSPRDAAWHRRPDFRARLQSCLRHGASAAAFHYLGEGNDGPGAKWWKKNLRTLIAHTGEAVLAQQLCCVEYFPYHSKTFGHAALRLPSQAYSFDLVRSAVSRGAVIIQLRGARFWEGAVPQLATYGNRFSTHTARSAAISPANCARGYPAILRALQRPAA